MRLIFICNNYPPVVDGVGDYTSLLAHELYHRGHEVHVICKKDARIVAHTGSGVNVWPIVENWTPGGCKNVFAIIASLQPDCVLLQYVPYGFNKWGVPLLLPVVISRINRQCRVILTVHEPYIRLQWWPAKTFVIGQLQRIIMQLLGKAADSVITSIDRYEKLIGKYIKKPIAIIPVPSNIIPVNVDADELVLLKNTIAPGGEKIIATFGIRDHALLIEVIKSIVAKNTHVKVLVTGTVTNKQVYEPVKQWVHVTGYLPAANIYRYLKVSDIFFLPDPIKNGNEGGASNKSGSLAAAFAADLPFVGTRGDMNNQLLQVAPYVYLETADATILSNRLIELLQRTPLNGNIVFWEKYLSVPTVALAYENILINKEFSTPVPRPAHHV